MRSTFRSSFTKRNNAASINQIDEKIIDHDELDKVGGPGRT